ncbi:uncharacterized protein L201_006742 [Kwoniella dendrophila CBS 6074]|uniref:WW domain-containing protein n=1 Tax=Kwoniella dendrophila CBS 6074 TaxID=1295534 RepID=A0AAX4K2F5_9TREE
MPRKDPLPGPDYFHRSAPSQPNTSGSGYAYVPAPSGYRYGSLTPSSTYPRDTSASYSQGSANYVPPASNSEIPMTITFLPDTLYWTDDHGHTTEMGSLPEVTGLWYIDPTKHRFRDGDNFIRDLKLRETIQDLYRTANTVLPEEILQKQVHLAEQSTNTWRRDHYHELFELYEEEMARREWQRREYEDSRSPRRTSYSYDRGSSIGSGVNVREAVPSSVRRTRDSRGVIETVYLRRR